MPGTGHRQPLSHLADIFVVDAQGFSNQNGNQFTDTEQYPLTRCLSQRHQLDGRSHLVFRPRPEITMQGVFGTDPLVHSRECKQGCVTHAPRSQIGQRRFDTQILEQSRQRLGQLAILGLQLV